MLINVRLSFIHSFFLFLFVWMNIEHSHKIAMHTVSACKSWFMMLGWNLKIWAIRIAWGNWAIKCINNTTIETWQNRTVSYVRTLSWSRSLTKLKPQWGGRVLLSLRIFLYFKWPLLLLLRLFIVIYSMICDCTGEKVQRTREMENTINNLNWWHHIKPIESNNLTSSDVATVWQQENWRNFITGLLVHIDACAPQWTHLRVNVYILCYNYVRVN